ncbi:LegC family aminotransferase [Azospirillum halopraeferens]|uniref:LegC family aminotransferase n=1 Tax=Azospirillum halopraeferens TaxID=34010 RepID=UPI00040A4E86|nr:LegC family aminotransferase [Azospirillum halopraeferens]
MTQFDPAPVVAALRSVTSPTRPLPLHEPVFAGREWDYVKDCLDTGWVSSVGAYVDRFERMLSQRAGDAHAVAVVNGTAALHVALMLAGVRTGDEVLVPALTFVATANAVAYCGALPHFVDSGPATLGLDPEALAAWLDETAERRDGACVNRRTGRRIAAVVPMHVFGHPVDMDGLAAVAGPRGIPIVEDAAESLGSLCRGRPTGGLGTIGTFSFNGNKIITAGGGGAIITADADLARRARHLTTTAKTAHPWAYEHDCVGFNYRLPNLNAALGCAQLEQLDGFIAAKRSLAAAYREALAGIPGVTFVDEPEGCRSIYWLNAVLVPDAAARDALLAATHAEGLLTRPAWGLMHRQPMYDGCPRAPLPVAESLADRLVCLPSGVTAGSGRSA